MERSVVSDVRLPTPSYSYAYAKLDMVALPEMFITGYNTQDLVLKPIFYQTAVAAIEALAVECADGPTLAIGGPAKDESGFYNAYYILRGGKVMSRVLKHFLPNETVFDEVRIFDSGDIAGPYAVGDMRIGTPICEDAWHVDVVETLDESGAEFLLVPNGSPYYRNKFDVRMNEMVSRVVESGLPLIYFNMVGGQDDQVFDGGSFGLNPGGELAFKMPAFDAVNQVVELENTGQGWRIVKGEISLHPDEWEQDYHCMVESLRDYMGKTGFKKVLLGLSGGIDSAIVATIAADALGPENVRCVMLPSEYTSQSSLDDAKDIANRLGCTYDFVPIKEGRDAITNTLAPLFEGTKPDGSPFKSIPVR